MKGLLSVTTVVLGAVAGFFGMILIASQWVRWFRISSFEGGSGYYVVLMALIGSVVGGIVAFAASRVSVVGNNPSFIRGAGYALTAIAASLFIVYVASWLIADHPPTIDGRRLVVELEIRTPAVTPLLDSAGYQPSVSLFNGSRKLRGYNSNPGSTVRTEGDRRVVSTRVELGSSAATRYLYVAWSDGCQFQTTLEMPGNPGPAQFEWSPWRDESAFLPSNGWEKPAVDLIFGLRYRVQFAPDVPPPPTAAERQAQDEAEVLHHVQALRASLTAIPHGAPIAQYLEFTDYGVPQDIKSEALARMRDSEHFTQEYAAAARHANGDTAAMWMRFAAEFPGDRAPVAEAIRLAGEDVRDRLEALDSTAKGDDDSGNVIYDVLVRFGGFFGSAFSLRELAAGDFAPELRGILKVARTRQNLPGIRSDVVRVASYYLQQWAGDAPAADDPPPK
jgi:hypothetical protein